MLIVGAGPTGLMLANQLARRGVRVHVVDRNTHAVRETRALGVQARTLEIYQKLGIAEQALALGNVGRGVTIWSGGRRKGHLSLEEASDGSTPFPYVFILGQDDNERLLGDCLRRSGVEVERQTELVAFEQHADRVVATLRHAGGSQRSVEAAWLAGCDGAHSTVRALAGIDFEGGAYAQMFFVADVELAGPLVDDELNMDLWKGGFILFFPMRGAAHWRIVGIVPAALRNRRDLAFADVEPSIVAALGAEIRVSRCSWFSTYRIAHRAAREFRRQRCFLLGDAAHVHSPAGAQGMNTGLQDAYNLGWKLALVVEGKADALLLDSYAAERRPVAEALLRTTDRAFRVAVSESALAGFLRTEVAARVAARLLRFPRLRARMFRLVSQLAIQYRDSPLSRSAPGWPRRAPRAGDRLPWMTLRPIGSAVRTDLFATLDDRCFQLVLIGQTLDPATIEPWGATHAYEADAPALACWHLPHPSYVLVRPDGHIALCGRHADPAALQAYFTRCLYAHAGSSGR